MARSREEGVSSNRTPAFTNWTLENDAAAQILSKKTRRLSRFFNANAEHYVNARVQKGRSPKPEYILSPVGLTDHPLKFSWAWLPPARGVYRVWPKGKLRPWTYIFMHSFGYTWDRALLRKNRQRQAPPGDEYGHHPTRWMAGIRQLCALNTDPNKKKQGSASIHFCISRRGDVVVSVDANDMAWHGGGDVRFTNKGNNYYSIGFELEPALARYKYANGQLSQPLLLPYPDRQMLALAIVCKKLVTFRPGIKEVYISKKNGSIRSQASQHGSGYIQHSDVKASKVDTGAQFGIPPGNIGLPGNPWLNKYPSGWETLWDLMRPMRFTLATDIFTKEIEKGDFNDISDLSVAMMKTTNAGQRAILQQQRDRVQGLRRASAMQAQARRTLYKQATSGATTMTDIISKSAANVTKQVERFNVAGVVGVRGDVQTYDFSSGTWKVGGTDTGQVT